MFRGRKVRDKKIARQDDNEWANCRPCNDDNKVSNYDKERPEKLFSM